MEWLRSRIRKSPKAALVCGKIVFLAGAILVVAAVFGRAEMINANAERAEARLPAVHTLDQAYPQYPTALVPEGPIGFTIAGLLTLVGMALTVVASDVSKARRR
jgi:hypothetical protein